MDDSRVRLAAFRWLEEQVRIHGEVLPRPLLLEGFPLDGQRVPLMSVQGIFKPRIIPEIPISITTTARGPYRDRMGPGGRIIYSYRGTDPQHPDNIGLRKALQRQVPLIYFHGLVPGKYFAVWPVYITGDNPAALEFEVVVEDSRYLPTGDRNGTGEVLLRDKEECGEENGRETGRRAYITALVKQRLHQQGFRERVLKAYRNQCAMCRLRHIELLEAAHIIPDGEPGGEPVVKNGISLCKLHHAAFDGFFLGIRPDFIVEVRKDILDEEDGPMLRHGLKELHGNRIWLPRSAAIQPSPEKLAIRYERFLTG